MTCTTKARLGSGLAEVASSNGPVAPEKHRFGTTLTGMRLSGAALQGLGIVEACTTPDERMPTALGIATSRT